MVSVNFTSYFSIEILSFYTISQSFDYETSKVDKNASSRITWFVATRGPVVRRVVYCCFPSFNFNNKYVTASLCCFVDNSTEASRQDCAIILTRMFCCEARKIFRQSPDISPLVSRILVSQSEILPTIHFVVESARFFFLFSRAHAFLSIYTWPDCVAMLRCLIKD